MNRRESIAALAACVVGPVLPGVPLMIPARPLRVKPGDQLIVFSGANPVTLTLPETDAFPAHFSVNFVRTGEGVVTVKPEGQAVVQSLFGHLSLKTKGACANLCIVERNVWMAMGSLS